MEVSAKLTRASVPRPSVVGSSGRQSLGRVACLLPDLAAISVSTTRLIEQWTVAAIPQSRSSVSMEGENLFLLRSFVDDCLAAFSCLYHAGCSHPAVHTTMLAPPIWPCMHGGAFVLDGDGGVFRWLCRLAQDTRVLPSLGAVSKLL